MLKLVLMIFPHTQDRDTHKINGANNIFVLMVSLMCEWIWREEKHVPAAFHLLLNRCF